MQETSIRSFTLEYYRSLGAELTPMDAGARLWQVALPPKPGQEARRSQSISFDPAVESSQIKAMGRTNPAWREILSDCVEARTVAYRHIVAEPVAHLATHLGHLLARFGVRTAQLVSVTPRAAVGFTHRVTFEAPAMASREEQLHHDLVDASSGERLDRLSDIFYSLPSIPINPPATPEPKPIEELHARTLAMVDDRTESHGQALESDLAPRLDEAEERISRYYASRIAEIFRQEESELDAKLEYLVQRTLATRLPGAIAKLQAEAVEVTEELEHIRIRRELESDGLRSEERDRHAAERARHEVTIETTLVSVAYVTYDVVHYRLELELPSGHAELQVGWVPVTDEILLEPCSHCALPLDLSANTPVVLDGEGQVVCHRCGTMEPVLEASEATPRPEAIPCSRCGVGTPFEAVQRCHLSDAPFCVVCAMTCCECHQVTAREHLRPNPHGRGMICPDHSLSCASCGVSALPRETFKCAECQDTHCQSHMVACKGCGMPRCASCASGKNTSCPACRSLKRIPADHALVGVLRGLIPDLGGLGWTWKLAVNGDFAVLNWHSPLGRTGYAVLGTQDYNMLTWKEHGLFSRRR